MALGVDLVSWTLAFITHVLKDDGAHLQEKEGGREGGRGE